MKNWIQGIVTAVSFLAGVGGFYYGRVQAKLARQAIAAQEEARQDQAVSLVRETRTLVYRGRATLPQTDWRPTGEEYMRLQDALNRLNTALKINPNIADAYGLRGTIYHRLGRYEQAIAAYKEAELRLGNEKAQRAVLLNNIGDLYLEQCKYKEAEEKFRESISVDPANALPYANLADTLRKQGRFREALEEVHKSIERDPDFVGAHLVLGRIYVTQGDLKQALPVLTRAVELDPDYQMETHLELSRAWSRVGRDDFALDHALDAVRIERNSAEAQRWLASAYRRVGDARNGDRAEARANALTSLRKSRPC